MAFPLEDKSWNDVRCFLKRHGEPLSKIFGPTEFLDFFPGTCSYFTDYIFPPEHFDFVLLPVSDLTQIRIKFLLGVYKSFEIVHANESFVVYARPGLVRKPQVNKRRVRKFLKYFQTLIKVETSPQERSNVAVLVKTHNRPWALERSLPQIVALGAPVLVVDDGSDTHNLEQKRQITETNGVNFLAMTENRGACCASNIGLSYWLADPDIEWISVFDDDVDVHPELLNILAKVQDKQERPILTGRYAIEHKTYQTSNGNKIADIEVYYQRSAPGVHLHAHRDYWHGVMPVPTPYLGAPKADRGRQGQGCDSDWWVTAWSPNSISKQGKYLVCVPGLVRHVAHTSKKSSWNNNGLIDHPEDQEFVR